MSSNYYVERHEQIYWVSREKITHLYHMVERCKTKDFLKMNWLLKVGLSNPSYVLLSKCNSPPTQSTTPRTRTSKPPRGRCSRCLSRNLLSSTPTCRSACRPCSTARVSSSAKKTPSRTTSPAFSRKCLPSKNLVPNSSRSYVCSKGIRMPSSRGITRGGSRGLLSTRMTVLRFWHPFR